MSFKRIVIALLALLSFCTVGFASSSIERNIWISSTQNFDMYFDSKSVIVSKKDYPTQRFVAAWIIEEYTEEGAKREFLDRQKAGLKTEGFENLKTKHSREIYSEDRRRCTKYIGYYSKNGETLLSVQIDNPEWREIPPMSFAEITYDALLKFISEPK